MSREIIEQVKEIVMSANRPMPAHFNSLGDRNQSFNADFKDISDEDETNMASEAYRSFYDYLTYLATDSTMFILKIGEDVMLGSYIITKLQEPDLADKLKKELVKENLQIIKDNNEVFAVELIDSSEAEDYLEHCMQFGKDKALAK